MGHPRTMALLAFSGLLLSGCGDDTASTTAPTATPLATDTTSKGTTSLDSSWNGTIRYGSVSDAQGRSYRTVTVGAQTWMAENLATVPTTAADSSWCYDNDTGNCTKYGRLYSWPTAMGIGQGFATSLLGASAARHRGICPQGWHLPQASEWAVLLDAIGSAKAGTRLKAATGWGSFYLNGITPVSGNGTDSIGFRALPAGYRSIGYLTGARFEYQGTWAWFWSADEFSGAPSEAYRAKLTAADASVESSASSKSYGLSVRCVKDVP